MKNLIFIFANVLLSSAFATAAPTQDAPHELLTCSFVESASISFGYSSVYTFKGTVTSLDPQFDTPFYEVIGPVEVSIDNTASTNRHGSHVADTTATINNHPWGPKVMLDIASDPTSGPATFHILVFPGALGNGTLFSAYKVNSNGNGQAGTCSAIDPRLIINE